MSLKRTLGIKGAADVDDAAALTSTADQPVSYAEAEAQKIRDDIAEVRTTLNELLAALRAGGVIG